MMLFYNCHPSSLIRCPSSLYGGIPILKGEKWACNLWFKEQQVREASPALRQRRKTVSPKFIYVI